MHSTGCNFVTVKFYTIQSVMVMMSYATRQLSQPENIARFLCNGPTTLEAPPVVKIAMLKFVKFMLPMCG